MHDLATIHRMNRDAVERAIQSRIDYVNRHIDEFPEMMPELRRLLHRSRFNARGLEDHRCDPNALIEHETIDCNRHGFSHGPAEVTVERWYTCPVANCGARYTPEEVEEMGHVFMCAQCQREIGGEYPAKGHADLCISCARTWELNHSKGEIK